MPTTLCYITPVLSGLQPAGAARVIAFEPAPKPVPAFPQYTVSRCGLVYRKGHRLQQVKVPGRCPRVRLNHNGKQHKISIARLVASTWVANPMKFTHRIFLDKDCSNCHAANLQWVSDADYRAWINEKKTAKRQKSEALMGILPGREKRLYNLGGVPVHGFPGYFITKEGVVYKTDRIIKPMKGTRGCLRVKLRYPTASRQYMRAGLATLVAEHFVHNPNKGRNKYVIFKDRDRHNCHAANLAWVDGETFMYYSTAANSRGAARKNTSNAAAPSNSASTPC